MMGSMAEVINDLIELFDKRDYAAVVVYKMRGTDEDESSVSITASVDELVDMAASIALVAGREMAQQFNLDGDTAASLVRDAVGERIITMGTTIESGRKK